MANINVNQRSGASRITLKAVIALMAAVLVTVNIILVPSITAKSDDGADNNIPPIIKEDEPNDSYWTELDNDESETDVPVSEISETDIPEEPEVELTVYEIELPYFITIDKIGQVVSIYTTNEEGKYETLVRQCICSTGEKVDKLPDGYYPLKNSKYKWQTMLSHGDPLYAQYTTRITGSFLFHSVPYTATKKNALDMKRYKNLGKANSGGCIRLTVECAKWIYDNCPAGTPVYVFKGKKDAELIERLRPPTPKNGWDPTDPDPNNPNYQPQYDESTEPKPYVYAPLYDYNFKWAPECDRIFYTSAKTETTTTSTESTTVSTETTTTTASVETTTTTTAETTTAATTTTEAATTTAATTTTTAADPQPES